jgi:hypothetical protein
VSSLRRRLAVAGVFAVLVAGVVALAGAAAGVTPPGNVTGLTATPQSATSIKLDWTNPTDTTFAGVHICRATGATAPTMPCTGVNVTKPTATLTDSQALIPNTQYTYAVFAYNTAGSTATGATVSATTPQAPAPGNVTGLTATPTTSIQLNWTNPTDTNFAGVHICRAFGAVAPTMPCSGVNVSKPTATYTDSFQIFAGTQYSYSVFAYNTAGVTASGVTVTTTTPH